MTEEIPLYDIGEKYIGNAILLPKLRNSWRATFEHPELELGQLSHQIIKVKRPTIALMGKSSASPMINNGMFSMVFEDDRYNKVSKVFQKLCDLQLGNTDNSKFKVIIEMLESHNSDNVVESEKMSGVYLRSITYSDLSFEKDTPIQIVVEFGCDGYSHSLEDF